MRILALETTEPLGTVAAMDGSNLLAELTLEQGLRSAQSLSPGLLAMLKQVGWQPNDVELIAVTSGPGSFTGLRVGVTTAKVFAYAVGAKIMGINTLEAVAAAVPREVTELATVLDAQRGEVVSQRFRRGPDGHFEPTNVEHLASVEAWAAELPPGVAVAGPILAKIASRVPPTATILDARFWAPRAAAVAKLAAHKAAAGQFDDLWQLVPHYCRKSAAEERLELA
jgi:tRNA threonylcarbamoyladenosine biosynthesis protein TsaB